MEIKIEKLRSSNQTDLIRLLIEWNGFRRYGTTLVGYEGLANLLYFHYQREKNDLQISKTYQFLEIICQILDNLEKNRWT